MNPRQSSRARYESFLALIRALPPRWINGGYVHFRNRLKAERLWFD